MYLGKDQANDVYYFVLAAQKAFPRLLFKQWVAVGHPQGGGAVWQLSEHELAQDPSSGYLGGVAIAPTTRLYDQFVIALQKLRDGAPGEGFGYLGPLPSVVVALQRQFPDYDAPLLTEEARKRVQLADIGQLCIFAASGLVTDLSPPDIFVNLNDDDDPKIRQFQTINSPAQGAPANTPLLVIQGSADQLIFPETTRAAFEDSCAFGNALHLSVYEGQDHTPVVSASSVEWLQFVEERFRGAVFAPGCSEWVVKFRQVV